MKWSKTVFILFFSVFFLQLFSASLSGESVIITREEYNQIMQNVENLKSQISELRTELIALSGIPGDVTDLLNSYKQKIQSLTEQSKDYEKIIFDLKQSGTLSKKELEELQKNWTESKEQLKKLTDYCARLEREKKIDRVKFFGLGVLVGGAIVFIIEGLRK